MNQMLTYFFFILSAHKIKFWSAAKDTKNYLQIKNASILRRLDVDRQNTYQILCCPKRFATIAKQEKSMLTAFASIVA
jgi:hypothetical protein